MYIKSYNLLKEMVYIGVKFVFFFMDSNSLNIAQSCKQKILVVKPNSKMRNFFTALGYK